MNPKNDHVLSLCTGGSARSIMAEALPDCMSGGRFCTYSAGRHPAGEVHPYAIDLLRANRSSVETLRSKSGDESARGDVPRIDFVITVCDKADGEQCPVWPGQPMTAHWGFTDPTADREPREHAVRSLSVSSSKLRAASSFSLRWR